MKLFLIDAYALIYRSYYAFIKNPRINSKGVNTSAIFGFINSLEDVLKRENPTHIAVAFDPKGPTFRHEAFEQYKAQREETPEVIRQSVPIIKEIIEAYNIPILEDDYVGDLRYDGRAQPALKALDPGGRVIYISTFSKMLMPGLRIGFLAAEGPFLSGLTQFKRLNDLASSNLLQRAVENSCTALHENGLSNLDGLDVGCGKLHQRPLHHYQEFVHIGGCAAGHLVGSVAADRP